MRKPVGEGQYKSNREVIQMRDLMILAFHRLTFLEMAVKGLRYKELHDAQAYAKFVEKKHAIEDIEIDQLKELLR